MLEKEFQYYKEHQRELVNKYNGKVIVIVGEEVVGVYDNKLDAFEESKDKYEIGTFLIQEVAPGKENYTEVFHSRVVFE